MLLHMMELQYHILHSCIILLYISALHEHEEKLMKKMGKEKKKGKEK